MGNKPVIKDLSPRADKRTWIDISHESYREYDFSNGKIRIDNPCWLCVEDGKKDWHGTPCHRIITLENESVWIPLTFLSLRWKSKDGTHFVK